jgi:hypothetical protein
MDRLLSIGFKPVGHWALVNNQMTFELDSLSNQKNILYAFVCNGHVKYVGKTVMTLNARISGYKTPGRTQRTNKRVHERINAQLHQGAVVEIFALPDDGLHYLGPFHLNLAAALEDDIIRVMKPEWNGGTPIIPVQESEMAESRPTTERYSPTDAIGNFAFVLQKSYFRQGFFNVGKANDALFGVHGEHIQIFLGHDEPPILGKINRLSTEHGAPRIMGGNQLAQWFQSHATVGDHMKVTVDSPHSIRIHTP